MRTLSISELFEDGLILVQDMVRLHQHAHDVAAGDTLAKFRNDKVSHESPYQLRGQSRRREGTKARSNWIFRSDNRCAKPSFAPSRLRAFAPSRLWATHAIAGFFFSG